MKALKTILFIVIGLPVLLAILAAILIFTVDPNVLKPRIESTLKDQGIIADFSGNIDWTFFPTLGLRVESVALKNADGQPLADIGVLDAGVELSPLFKKQIVVDSVILRDSTLHYITNSAQSTNWSIVTDQQKKTPETKNADDSGDTSQNLNVQTVDISNLTLRSENKLTGESSAVEGAFLRSKNINLAGDTFPIEMGLILEAAGLPETVLGVKGALGVDQAKKQAKMVDGVFSVKPGKAAIDAQLNFDMNWGEMAGNGALNISPTKIRPLLEAFSIPEPRTRKANAVDQLAGSAQFAFTDKSFALKETKLTLDDFTLTGYANVSAFEPLKVKSEWQGTAINLDHYLPPPSSEEEAQETDDAPEVESPLPLETIRGIGDADIRVAIKEVIISELPIQNLVFTTRVNNGVARSSFDSKAAAGDIKAKANFDARGSQGKLSFDGQTTGIDVGKLLAVFTEKEHLQGALNTKVRGSSIGATNISLMDNLTVNAEAQSDKVTLVPINVEQAVCQAIAKVQGKTLPEYDWQARTELSPITTVINYTKDVVKVNTLQATIANFRTEAGGTLNLETGKFEFPLELRVADFAKQLEGCVPISEKWRNVSFPILCEGTLEGMDFKTCLPNTSKLGRLVEQRAKNEAKEKLDAQKDKAEDKLKDKVKEKLGEEKTKELKGLFDALRGK